MTAESETQTIYVDTGEVRQREYIGDGLYAARDDNHIILFTERENGTHWVALEPDVFARLTEYKNRVMP